MYAMTETVQRKTWKNKALYSKGYGKKNFPDWRVKAAFQKEVYNKILH